MFATTYFHRTLFDIATRSFFNDARKIYKGNMKYKCINCGKIHKGLPDLAFNMPIYADQICEEQRDKRVKMNKDICIIDNEDYFIRGFLGIPIINSNKKLGIGVWVSQKKENFECYFENYDSNKIGPFFGWLSNVIPFYEETTLNLKTMAHFQGKGLRPIIELEPTEHPLSIDYHYGISIEKAWDIAHFCLDDKTNNN